jgi:hypothetical protein
MEKNKMLRRDRRPRGELKYDVETRRLTRRERFVSCKCQTQKIGDLPDVEQQDTEAGLKVKKYGKLMCAVCISVKGVTDRKFSDSPKAAPEDTKMTARDATATDSKGESVHIKSAQYVWE